jgi:high-affinity nickel-transport protein
LVILDSAAIAGAAIALQHRLDVFRNIALVLSTLLSAFFVFAIAIVNLIVLRSIYQAFVKIRRREPHVEEDFEHASRWPGLPFANISSNAPHDQSQLA